jgi:signal transduction histidine kinase
MDFFKPLRQACPAARSVGYVCGATIACASALLCVMARPALAAWLVPLLLIHGVFIFLCLRALLRARLRDAIHQERNRILQDIHDGLGARLINLLLETRAAAITPQALEMDLQACLEELRLLVNGPFMDEAPFTEVLDEFCQRAARNLRTVGIQLHYHLDPLHRGALDAQCARHLLHIIQELVSNTIKHSQAKNCKILLKRQHSQITLEVGDDGVGFDNHDKNGIMKRGLRNLHQRLKKLGAEYTFGADSQGTHLKLILNVG